MDRVLICTGEIRIVEFFFGGLEVLVVVDFLSMREREREREIIGVVAYEKAGIGMTFVCS